MQLSYILILYESVDITCTLQISQTKRPLSTVLSLSKQKHRIIVNKVNKSETTVIRNTSHCMNTEKCTMKVKNVISITRI